MAIELKANPGKNVEIDVDGEIFQRYAIQTHFVEIGEDYVELVEKYVKPSYQEGDILSISEKIVSLCQKNIVYKDDMKVSGLAKFLSKFATQHSSAGIGVGDVYKMQFAIDQVGSGKVLWAAICAGFGKLVGKKGIFYEMVGEEVTGLDGFYPDVWPIYGNFGILIPKEPDKVCDTIYEKTGVRAMVVDANDFTVTILGKSSVIEYDDETLAKMIKDNPTGQGNERTPFILIRKKS